MSNLIFVSIDVGTVNVPVTSSNSLLDCSPYSSFGRKPSPAGCMGGGMQRCEIKKDMMVRNWCMCLSSSMTSVLQARPLSSRMTDVSLFVYVLPLCLSMPLPSFLHLTHLSLFLLSIFLLLVLVTPTHILLVLQVRPLCSPPFLHTDNISRGHQYVKRREEAVWLARVVGCGKEWPGPKAGRWKGAKVRDE